jgi:hypothetical protein
VRYAEAQYGEQPIAIGVFTPGDAPVTIQLLDLATDALVPLTSNLCTESMQIPGFFYWDGANCVTPPVGFHQCLYVMTNAAGRTHAGKLVIGGYPSDSAIRRFQQMVWIDVATGAAGTAFPLGTPENPVSNPTDARTIADRENLTAYHVKGAIVISADHEDWTFEGEEPQDDRVTFTAGFSTDGSQFLQIGIRGDLAGPITAKECLVGTSGGTVTGLCGTFTMCGFDGTIRPAPAPRRIEGLDLASRNANILNPGTILDFNNAQCIVLGTFTGYWVVRNIVNPAAILAVAGNGLHLTAESTVAGGVFTLLGNGEFVDDSTSISDLRDFLIRGSRIDIVMSSVADAVLAEPVGDHDGVADSLAAVLRRVSHHSVGRARFNTSNPLQWTLDVYEDDDRTAVAEQFNLKRLDGTAINAANPDPITDDLVADVDPA